LFAQFFISCLPTLA
jgi:hypothetical protein